MLQTYYIFLFFQLLGIEFGKIGYGNITEPVKYAGTGKIIRVG
jgi:hypothetical protein